MVRIVSLAVLTTLIIVLGLTFFKVIAPFLIPLFLAGVFAILCQPLYRYFIRRTNERPRVAAGLTTGVILAGITVPLCVGVIVAGLQLFVLANDLASGGPRYHKVAQEVNDTRSWLNRVGDWGVRKYVSMLPEQDTTVVSDDSIIVEPTDDTAGVVPDPLADNNDDRTAVDASPAIITTSLTDEQRVEAIKQDLKTQLLLEVQDFGGESLGLAGKTLGGLAGSLLAALSAILSLMMFAIALYYFLADGPALLEASEKLIPVHVEYQRELMDQFAKVVRSVVSATFLAALVQGVATTIALMLCGFGHLFVLFIAATIASLIPLAGTWMVWAPCAVYLFIGGHWIAGTLLTIFGIGVVGMMDNVIRTYILNTDTKLHPLLAFISVLGGLQVMGLWGVFVGPIVACCLHALVKIFNHELSELSKEKFSDLSPIALPAEAGASADPTPVATPPPRDDPSPNDDGDGATAPVPDESSNESGADHPIEVASQGDHDK